MNEPSEDKSYATALRSRRLTAAVLLIVAAAALAAPYVPFNWREGVLLLMGLGFILWSALARSPGLLVPGGVLTGVGAGILLRQEYGNGAFLLAMAGGFLLIAALSPILHSRRCGALWALWPAAGLGFAGLIQMAGPDLRALWRDLSPYWPLVLVAVAVYLLVTKPARDKT